LKQVLVLPILLLASLATEAKAAFKDGNKLYSECTSSPDYVLVCMGYVQGVVDAGDQEAFLLEADGRTIAGFRWCASDRANTKQAVDIVVRYLRDNPQRRHLVAAGLVAEALSQAWPCPAGVK
jgi:hypothetical protein